MHNLVIDIHCLRTIIVRTDDFTTTDCNNFTHLIFLFFLERITNLGVLASL